MQFKGFLESLNERMANLGVELGQEVAMNPDTEARARDLIKPCALAVGSRPAL